MLLKVLLLILVIKWQKTLRIKGRIKKKILIQKMRQPGIEPGSTAWKAAMLTTIPLTLINFT